MPELGSIVTMSLNFDWTCSRLEFQTSLCFWRRDFDTSVLTEGILDESVTCETEFLPASSRESRLDIDCETRIQDLLANLGTRKQGVLRFSTAVIIDISTILWQCGRKGSFKTSGWKAEASMQHLGRLSHFFINLVIFPWILEILQQINHQKEV